MISSTVLPTTSEGGFGVFVAEVVRTPLVPAAEVGMVEAVDAAATVVGVKVVADVVGRLAKLKAPPVLAEVSDGITKPVDGADVAGVEGALVFAGIEKLGPPP